MATKQDIKNFLVEKQSQILAKLEATRKALAEAESNREKTSKRYSRLQERLGNIEQLLRAVDSVDLEEE